MLKNILKIIVFFVVGMVGGIFSDQILWPYFVERPLFYQYKLDQNPIEVTEIREITVRENEALTSAIEKVESVIVGIKSQTSNNNFLEGSGLIVTSDGFVVVLMDFAPKYATSTVFIDGKSLPLRLLKQDSKTGLALLKVESNNLPTVGFADFGRLKLGQRVFLVGADFKSSTSSIEKMVSEGIVQKFSSLVIETSMSEGDEAKGSILFNVSGEVLGINEINSKGKVIAIPVSKIKEIAGM